MGVGHSEMTIASSTGGVKSHNPAVALVGRTRSAGRIGMITLQPLHDQSWTSTQLPPSTGSDLGHNYHYTPHERYRTAQTGVRVYGCSHSFHRHEYSPALYRARKQTWCRSDASTRRRSARHP